MKLIFTLLFSSKEITQVQKKHQKAKTVAKTI